MCAAVQVVIQRQREAQQQQQQQPAATPNEEAVAGLQTTVGGGQVQFEVMDCCALHCTGSSFQLVVDKASRLGRGGGKGGRQ